MTCIVAYERRGRIWMGGDSASVGGLGLCQVRTEKVFENEGLLFGFTTSWRMGQLLRYRFTAPRHHPDQDLTEFMSTDFIDGVRGCLKKYGYSTIKDNEETGGTFLVALEGVIFKIDSDFQVCQSVHPFDAVGCGEDIANGVMAALTEESPRMDGAKMVLAALRAAETFSAGVRGPFHVIESKASE